VAGVAGNRANLAAMVSSEVQRTLVKSPPELWAELSDPAALARHLGELGEIRIVRTDPESTVEWAAENTTGTVSIKPSGWGTKVTLSVTREMPEAAAQPQAPPETEAPGPGVAAEPVTIAGATSEAEPTALGTETEAETTAKPEPAPETADVPHIEPQPESEPDPRRGFFARLFGRRRKTELPPSFGQPDAFAAVTNALAPETFAAEHPFAVVPSVQPAPAQPAPEQTAPDPPPASDPAAPEPIARDIQTAQADGIPAELMAAEEAGAEEVTAVLTAVLDRLGAAHHRPFSRS
jgi:hypothetical protein